MKKTIAILLAALMAVMLLAACGSSKSYDSSGSSGSSWSYNGSAPMASSSPSSTMMYEEYGIDKDYSYEQDYAGEVMSIPGDDRGSGNNTSSGSGGETVAKQIASSGAGDGLAEKIIYTASANVETIEFDETIDKLYDLMGFNGAFIEDSYIGGRTYSQSYYNWQTYRTAHFTLRVPVKRLAEMIDSLSALGNVISRNSMAQNITSQFYDMESRLSSYRIQEERLLAMLGKCETVEEMLEIESRLAEVRYSIESMTTTLRGWQNQVDYSTLTIYIEEVAELSEIAPPLQRTYWQQIGDGFSSTVKSIIDFFKNLLKWLIVNILIIAIWAVIIVAAVLFIRRLIKRSRYRLKTPFGNQRPGDNGPYPPVGGPPPAGSQQPPAGGWQQPPDDD